MQVELLKHQDFAAVWRDSGVGKGQESKELRMTPRLIPKPVCVRDRN